MYVYCTDHTVALIEETKEFEGQLFLKRIGLPFPVQPGNQLLDLSGRPKLWPQTCQDVTIVGGIFVQECGLMSSVGQCSYLKVQTMKQNHSSDNNLVRRILETTAVRYPKNVFRCCKMKFRYWKMDHHQLNITIRQLFSSFDALWS